MYWPWSSTRWMRPSISRLSARYCVFRSVNSIAYLPLQLFDFLLDRLVLRQLPLQEAGGRAHLLARPLGREVVRVGELVVAVPEVAHLDQAAPEQRAQAEVHLADAHAELARELALRQLGVPFEQAQQAIARRFIQQEGLPGGYVQGLNA